MNLDALQTFVAVMRAGSFAAVARQRDVDPSSISRAIAALEAELGLRLFQRTTRRLSPTEAGAVYFERIEPLVEELALARSLAADVTERPAGLLRVTASVAFGHMCLVPHLGELRARFPDLSIELLLTDSNVDLLAERIDVAIRLGPKAGLGLIRSKLFQTTYSVVASPAYLDRHGGLESPKHLEARDCLLFTFPGFRSRWIFEGPDGARTEVPVHGKLLISNALALHSCALAGMGCALLANWMIERDVARGALIEVLPDYRVTATDFDTAAWIVYPSRKYLPLKVRAFIDFLRERLA